MNEQNYEYNTHAPQTPYQTQPPFQPQPAYQEQPAYQPQPAYQAQPNYQEQAAYQAQPAYQQPAYQQPAYQQPAYQQPTYQQPTYQQTVYQQPGYQPVPQQPMNPAYPQQGAAIAPHLLQRIDDAFGSALGSVIVSQFPIGSIVAIVKGSNAIRAVDEVNYYLPFLPGKAVAAKVLGKIGKILGIANTILWPLVLILYLF